MSFSAYRLLRFGNERAAVLIGGAPRAGRQITRSADVPVRDTANNLGFERRICRLELSWPGPRRYHCGA